MKQNSFLFNIDIPTGNEPAVGSLLVAEPFLRESYFNHAVIVMVDYEPGMSAMGVVVNNPSEYTLQDVIDSVKVETPIPVYCGGPVGSDRLYFLHTLGDLIPDSTRLADGLWLGGDFDALLSIINDGYDINGRLRFFLGYSGWTAGQLENEIAQRVWAVGRLDMDPHILFETDGNKTWHSAVSALGPAFKGWFYHPKDVIAN
ncbi:MAG: YqgE/AlgH family protein [Muribaculaceae bacterium]|nr:YqgE/AlgH family protein [Muribaculaceae bacterium]